MIVTASENPLPLVPKKGAFVVLATPESRHAALHTAALSAVYEESGRVRTTHYDALSTHDYFAVLLPDFTAPNAEPALIEAFFATERLVLVLPELPAFATLRAQLQALDEASATPAHVLYLLLSALLAGDYGRLEDIEDEIELMEEKAVKPHPVDCTTAVIALRKRLLALQRYYDALFDALDDLQENQNGFFCKQDLQAVGRQKNRVDRLKNSVSHLREYLTQVREAYQNQLDIGLNETMQVFTVITAIFLPLTLIVGWYGMNLNMPEYSSNLTYPIVVVVSLVIVAACLWVFRKKKWF